MQVIVNELIKTI